VAEPTAQVERGSSGGSQIRVAAGNAGENWTADSTATGGIASPAPVAAPRRRGLLDALRSALSGRTAVLIAIVTVALVIAGQVAEDFVDGAGLQLLPPSPSVPRWTVIAVAVYLVIVVEVVRGAARDAMVRLRPVVKIDDAAFDRYATRMGGHDRGLEVRLLAVSALVVLLLFPVLGVSLPTADDPVTGAAMFMPPSPIAAALVVLGYGALGWAGLRLVEITVRVARTLGRLSREPIEVNVFDTTHLLPLGNIALAASLASVGVIAIFLLGLGAPATVIGWAVLLLATSASVLALVLPLRGIHRQMRRAKDDALTGLNRQLSEVHALVGSGTPVMPDAPTLGQLNDRASLIVALRRVVAEMPTWPFRDTVAFGRAVLIASAPVIYAALNGLVDAFFVQRIAG
jgi:hypothetical protein